VFRFAAMTLNLWAHDRWPERQDAVTGLLTRRGPDVLALQEVRPDTLATVRAALPEDDAVEDDHPGWRREGNLLWDRRLFACEEHGAEPLSNLSDYDHLRRVFWVRLRPLAVGAVPVVVASAHYSYPDSPGEAAGRFNPRIAQAQETVAALDRVAGDGPCLFMGDLNDYRHPLRILVEGGFQHAAGALGVTLKPTHPAFPTAWDTPHVIDWQLHRGPVRPLATEVVDFFAGDFAPSDHKPLVTVYALDAT
jgi:hypothetical protein